jgi:ABC-type lipoprotein release transport system permease subunit
MLPAIAWKNCWRNNTRSLIIITAVAFGLFGGLLSSALNFGLGEQMIDNSILTRLSHIQIHNHLFSDDQNVKYRIPDARVIAEKIRLLPAVSAVAYRVVITAMVSTATTATGVQLYGVIPESEMQVSNISESMVEGSYFGSDTRYPAVIGMQLAKTLDVTTGSKIILTFQNDSGIITGAAFSIAGIFKTVSTDFGKSNVFVKSEDISNLLGIDSSYHEIAVLLNNSSFTDSIASKIKLFASGLKIDTWKTLAPELEYVSASLSVTLYIFMAVILFALAFGIINTMLMAVLERQRELGMLMALGMKGSMVFEMIVYETIFLSMTGAFAGMVLTALSMVILSRTGINLALFAEGLAEFGVGEILYPVLPFTMYLVLTVMVIITALLAAVYPAVKAIRLSPADALRM